MIGEEESVSLLLSFRVQIYALFFRETHLFVYNTILLWKIKRKFASPLQKRKRYAENH
jgi:hypothetical protein